MENELRSAVEKLKLRSDTESHILCELGKRYLDVDGWPNNKTLNNPIITELQSHENYYRDGFNESLHLCKLAYLKKLDSVDGWPETKEKLSPIPFSANDTFYNQGVAHGKVEGFNEALSLCKLAHLKEKEKHMKETSVSKTLASLNDKQDVWVNQEHLLERCSVENLYKTIRAHRELWLDGHYHNECNTLATAIFNLIKGEEK